LAADAASGKPRFLIPCPVRSAVPRRPTTTAKHIERAVRGPSGSVCIAAAKARARRAIAAPQSDRRLQAHFPAQACRRKANAALQRGLAPRRFPALDLHDGCRAQPAATQNFRRRSRCSSLQPRTACSVLAVARVAARAGFAAYCKRWRRRKNSAAVACQQFAAETVAALRSIGPKPPHSSARRSLDSMLRNRGSWARSHCGERTIRRRRQQAFDAIGRAARMSTRRLGAQWRPSSVEQIGPDAR